MPRLAIPIKVTHKYTQSKRWLRLITRAVSQLASSQKAMSRGCAKPSCRADPTRLMRLCLPVHHQKHVRPANAAKIHKTYSIITIGRADSARPFYVYFICGELYECQFYGRFALLQ